MSLFFQLVQCFSCENWSGNLQDLHVRIDKIYFNNFMSYSLHIIKFMYFKCTNK